MAVGFLVPPSHLETTIGCTPRTAASRVGPTPICARECLHAHTKPHVFGSLESEPWRLLIAVFDELRGSSLAFISRVLYIQFGCTASTGGARPRQGRVSAGAVGNLRILRRMPL